MARCTSAALALVWLTILMRVQCSLDEAGHCPKGFYRAAPALFGCDRRSGHTHLLLSKEPARIRVPRGVQDFRLQVEHVGSAVDMAVQDPSTGRDLVKSSAEGTARWRGVELRLRTRPPEARLDGRLPANLDLVLAGEAGGGLEAVGLQYSFGSFPSCQPLPVGCLRFEREQARDLVVRWSQWVSDDFPSAEAAWDSLCKPHADSSGAVPFGLWDAVWSRWPAAAGQYLDWQVAFKFIDQCTGMPEDGLIDKADFTTAFRLAAVRSEVFLWCQNLRATHRSSKAAWASLGSSDETTYGGIIYSTWETQAWKDRRSPEEDAFAYVDQDGDNIISSKEFFDIYWSCNASGSVLRPGKSDSLPPVPTAARPIGSRCFAYRPAEFDGGERSAFGDVIAQQWNLFLLDEFASRDAFTWDMPTGGVSWSSGQVSFHGGGRSLRTQAALYRSTGTIAVSAAITRSGVCDNHFVMLSTSASEAWSWRPTPTSVKFAWSCGSKYILSRSASASTSCPALGSYILSITLDAAGGMVFQDDHGCKDLVLEDQLGSNGEPLYLYIGGDGPPGNNSAFDEISIRIGLNSVQDSEIVPSTATACLYDGAQYEGPLTGANAGRSVEPSLAKCQHRCAKTPGCAHFSFQLWSHSCDLFDGGAAWHRHPGVISGPPHCIVGIEMRMHGVDAARLSPFERNRFASKLASQLAAAADLTNDTIKDASGTPSLVSLTGGEMLACGFASLPSGRSLAGVASHLAGGALQSGIRNSLEGLGVFGSTPEQLRVETSVWALPAAQCMLLNTAYRPSMLLQPQGQGSAENVSTCQARCVRTLGCTQFTFRREHGTCHMHNASATAVWEEGSIAGPRVCAALPSVLEATSANRNVVGGAVGSATHWWILGTLLFVGIAVAVTLLVLDRLGLLRNCRLAMPGLGKLELPSLAKLQLPQLPKFEAPQWARMGMGMSLGTGMAGPALYQPLSAQEVDSRPTSHSGRSSRASDATPVARQARISMVFEALDCRRRNHLGLSELRRYADFCGFDGTDSDWVEEYRAMASENGWDEGCGMDRQQFHSLVNDVNGKGYCTDDELAGFLEELQSETSSKLGYQHSHSSGQSTA